VRVRISNVTIFSGTRATSEQRLDVEQLTIGRGTDNTLRIPGASVPLHHSVVERHGDGFRLRLLEASEAAGSGALTPGEVLRIGQYRVEVLAPTADADVALRVEQIEAPAVEQLASRSRLGIERGLLTRGRLSWAAALALIAAFLGAPLLARAPRTVVDRLPAWLRVGGNRIVSAAWKTGPLSHVHANLESNCTACHATAFAAVPDASCRSERCHPNVASHVGAGVHVDALATTPCTSCHDEHHGDDALITATDPACVTCHRDLRAVHPATTLGDASAFGTRHPEFRPSVVAALDSRATRRITLDAPDLREQSGLTFSHQKHLASGLRSPSGPVTLQCASCHVPDADGALMRLVTFRDHCQSCHLLTFADGNPTRQVPHGDPATAQADVEEFFSARALAGAAADAPELPRRQPGRDLSEAERLQALAWARRRSDAASRSLFDEQGACALCHTLDRSSTPPRVLPVSLLSPDPAHRWLSLASFNHDSHAKVAACRDCHPATGAETSAAVLLPRIARCRECHAPSAAAATRALSDCTQCHRFHFCGAPAGTTPPRIATAYEDLCR
jgi:hypothetical protein